MKRLILPFLIMAVAAFFLFGLDDSYENEIFQTQSPFSQSYQDEFDRIIRIKEQYKYRINYSIKGLKDTLNKEYLMLYVKAFNLRAVIPVDITQTNEFENVQNVGAKGYVHAKIKGLKYERDSIAYNYLSHRWIAD